jgi:hypothetical protein
MLRLVLTFYQILKVEEEPKEMPNIQTTLEKEDQEESDSEMFRNYDGLGGPTNPLDWFSNQIDP